MICGGKALKKVLNELKNNTGFTALLIGYCIIAILFIISIFFPPNYDNHIEQRNGNNVDDYEIFNPMGGNWNLFTKRKTGE